MGGEGRRAAGARLCVFALLGALLGSGCAGGPPVHTEAPTRGRLRGPQRVPERDARPIGGGVRVRVALQWGRGECRIAGQGDLELVSGERVVRPRDPLLHVRVVPEGGASVRITDSSQRTLWDEPGPVRVRPRGGGYVEVGERSVRGELKITARAGSLFVVNVVALEDYLRGVVPREIGPRPPEEREGVAAQAIAARTYTVKRLGQYDRLPFDLFASVQDQAYEGVGGEDPVADAAIRETRGLVLADEKGLIEAFYSSTCGGRRSDIAAVWPHREVHRALRGGRDGPRGREWCRTSPHFAWRESWDGRTLSALVRKHVPEVLELEPGSVRGELVDLRIGKRGPSGRAARIEYVTTEGRWVVPGDRNRWVLRRPGGEILRSIWVDLRVQRRRGRVVKVIADGRGNGHGVGMCQVGALGRARAGQSFREILAAYYPGVRIRPIRGSDLPPGRAELP